MFRRSPAALPDPVLEVSPTLPDPILEVVSALSDRVPEANHVLPNTTSEASLALPGPVPEVFPSLSDRVPKSSHVLPNTTSEASLALPGPVPGARPTLPDRVSEALQNLDELAATVDRRENVPPSTPAVSSSTPESELLTTKCSDRAAGTVQTAADFSTWTSAPQREVAMNPTVKKLADAFRQRHQAEQKLIFVEELLLGLCQPTLAQLTVLYDFLCTAYREQSQHHLTIVGIIPDEDLAQQEAEFEKHDANFYKVATVVAELQIEAEGTEPVSTSVAAKNALNRQRLQAESWLKQMLRAWESNRVDPLDANVQLQAPGSQEVVLRDRAPAVCIPKPEPNLEPSLNQLKSLAKQITTKSTCEFGSDSRIILRSEQPSAVGSRPREDFNMNPIADNKFDFLEPTGYLKDVTAEAEPGPVMPAIPSAQVSLRYRSITHPDPRGVHSEEPKNLPDFELQQNCAEPVGSFKTDFETVMTVPKYQLQQPSAAKAPDKRRHICPSSVTTNSDSKSDAPNEVESQETSAVSTKLDPADRRVSIRVSRDVDTRLSLKLSLSAMAACGDNQQSQDSNRHRGTKSDVANETRSQRLKIRLPIVSADRAFAEVPEDVANSEISEHDEESPKSRQRASFCEVHSDSIPEQNPEAVLLDRTVALDPDINRFHSDRDLNNPEDKADFSRVTKDSSSKVTKMIPRSRVPGVHNSVKNTHRVHLDIVPETSFQTVKTVAEKNPLMPPVSKAPEKLKQYRTMKKTLPRAFGVPPTRCQPRQVCQECAKPQNQTKELTNQEIDHNKDSDPVTDDCALQVPNSINGRVTRRDSVTTTPTGINPNKLAGRCRIVHSETASYNPFRALQRQETISVSKKQGVVDAPDRTDDLALNGGAERTTPRKICHAVAVLQLLQEPRDTFQNKGKKPATQSKPNDSLYDEKIAQNWLIDRELVATKMLNTSYLHRAEANLTPDERETLRPLGEARPIFTILKRPWDPGSTCHTSKPISDPDQTAVQERRSRNAVERTQRGEYVRSGRTLAPTRAAKLTTPLRNGSCQPHRQQQRPAYCAQTSPDPSKERVARAAKTNCSRAEAETEEEDEKVK
ncbi:uncharacterized protein LOC119766646 [Culex quinquefasciatus]|uniref:uncharacterized protein LOC119766646 n=1 Tax=Culex quinquefasciatus TaxID=7176 RepID=UPI0018E3861A|nr:uncharacterized protein LOC119766646 [Culex quinquefasciatus]